MIYLIVRSIYQTELALKMRKADNTAVEATILPDLLIFLALCQDLSSLQIFWIRRNFSQSKMIQ